MTCVQLSEEGFHVVTCSQLACYPGNPKFSSLKPEVLTQHGKYTHIQFSYACLHKLPQKTASKRRRRYGPTMHDLRG